MQPPSKRALQLALCQTQHLTCCSPTQARETVWPCYCHAVQCTRQDVASDERKGSASTLEYHRCSPSVLCPCQQIELPFLDLQGDNAGSFAHEAGYDAYMTGASFAALLRLLELRRADGAGFDVPEAGCAAEAPSLDAAGHFLGQLNLVRWAAAREQFVSSGFGSVLGQDVSGVLGVPSWDASQI